MPSGLTVTPTGLTLETGGVTLLTLEGELDELGLLTLETTLGLETLALGLVTLLAVVVGTFGAEFGLETLEAVTATPLGAA